MRQAVIPQKGNPARASSDASFEGGLCLLGLLNTTKGWFTYNNYSASNMSLLHGLRRKTTPVANSVVLDTPSRTHSLQMSLFWQAALDPSKGQLMWPRPQTCPCLAHPCETSSSQCTTGLGTRTVQLVMYQVLKHPTFPPSLTQSLFISSSSFTQAEAAGLVLATGTGQCC